MVRADAGKQLHPANLALEPALTGTRPVQPIASDAARIPAQAKPAASPARSETKFPERKSPDARWLDLRWLIPVAAMLVLGTFVFMRFPSHVATVGPNQVAMSKSAPPPQEQAAPEQEKKASDFGTPDKSELKNQQSTSRSQSSAKPGENGASTSESARIRRNEAVSTRGTASTSVGAAGSRGPTKTEKAPVYVFHSPEWRTTEAPSDRNPKKEKFPTEPAPAAPAPELNASMPTIVVATSSAEAVKSPAPAPPPSAETKSQAFGLAGRGNLHSSTAAKSLAKEKSAEERYTETVIPTPDSDIFYRIAGGGFVEISEDGGATWQRQLLNPSAEFTAGSAPEPRICWLVGSSGIVFLTEDGKNWRKLPSPTSEDLVVVLAKSASSATVTANNDRKWSTDDAGKNWHPVK
jgi:hypothetical protein